MQLALIIEIALAILCCGSEAFSDHPNPCAGSPCNQGEKCVPDRKNCVRAPCPQYLCVQDETNPCQTVLCPPGQKCVPEPKQCFTTPCPQFACVNDACQYMRCRAGYTCQNGQCTSSFESVGNPVGSSCPPTTISTCDWTDCTETGCGPDLMCCPKGCGGTSCQKPI